jgi:hypothetical protein
MNSNTNKSKPKPRLLNKSKSKPITRTNKINSTTSHSIDIPQTKSKSRQEKERQKHERTMMSIADKQSKQLRKRTKQHMTDHLKLQQQHNKTIAILRQKILKFQRLTTPTELPEQLEHIPWNPHNNKPLREDQYQEYVDGLTKAEEVEQYIGSLFQINQRLYEVLYIYYDMDKKALAAYRRPIDGLPATNEDGLPALFEGKNNIKERILDYEDCAHFTQDSLRWPETETEMRNAQMTDPELAQMIRALESNTPIPQHLESNIIEYTMQDDEDTTGLILRGTYKHRQHMPTLNPDICTPTVTILPQNLKALVLKYFHNDLGHPGMERLRMSLSLRYYWTNMQHDIKCYVRNCRFCAARKADNTRGKIPRFRFPNTKLPFQRTNIDIIGPLPITEHNHYRYILVIKEPLTQWIEVVPLTDKTAETVTHAIITHLYNIHGIPDVIITDNGTEFVNNTTALVQELLQIDHHKTVPYHPEANGLVENQNRTIKDMLSSFIDANQLDWPKWLPIVIHAYRTTVSPITGFSPFRLLYGREARQPSDSWITKFALKHDFDINTYVSRLTEVMQYTWDKAAQRIDHIHTQRDQIHNNPTLRTSPAKEKYFIPYEINDLFMLESIPKRYILETTPTEKLRLKINAKLQMRYIGPYTITKVINPTTYLAKIDNKEIRVHASRMKRVHPSPKDYLPIFSQFFNDDISDDNDSDKNSAKTSDSETDEPDSDSDENYYEQEPDSNSECDDEQPNDI